MGASGQVHAPSALSPGENPCTPCLAPEPVETFRRRENLLSLLGFETRTMQPVASRHNGYTISSQQSLHWPRQVPRAPGRWDS